VVRELIEEAERRGVKVGLLLLDRAFFTVECINLPKELRIRFVMPCVSVRRRHSLWREISGLQPP
jgi:hypothetical protein